MIHYLLKLVNYLVLVGTNRRSVITTLQWTRLSLVLCFWLLTSTELLGRDSPIDWKWLSLMLRSLSLFHTHMDSNFSADFQETKLKCLQRGSRLLLAHRCAYMWVPAQVAKSLSTDLSNTQGISNTKIHCFSMLA